MKFQQIIAGKHDGPRSFLFSQYAAPVKEVDGKWVLAGPLRDETHRYDHGTIMVGAAEYDPRTSTCGYVGDIPVEEGWMVMARFWLPDNYVPESDEVLTEGDRRAAEEYKRIFGEEEYRRAFGDD